MELIFWSIIGAIWLILKFIAWLKEEDGWYGDAEGMMHDHAKVQSGEMSRSEFENNKRNGKYFVPIPGNKYPIGKKKRGKKQKPKTLEENLAEERKKIIGALTKLYNALGKDPSIDNIENDFRNFKIKAVLSIEYKKSFLYDDGEVALGIDYLGNIHEKEFFSPYSSCGCTALYIKEYQEKMTKKTGTENN